MTKYLMIMSNLIALLIQFVKQCKTYSEEKCVSQVQVYEQVKKGMAVMQLVQVTMDARTLLRSHRHEQ